MSDLETQIRNISLKSPSEALDARVFAVLRDNDESIIGDRKNEQQDAARTSDSIQTIQPGRRGAAMTSGWIVAAVSMAIGAIAGRSLPSFSEIHGHRSQHVSVEETTALNSENQQQQFLNTPELEIKNQDSRLVSTTNGHTESSQIAESLWISPLAAAVAWEQQTGQIFNVRNHINDRRFDMCRDCHRVGG